MINLDDLNSEGKQYLKNHAQKGQDYLRNIKKMAHTRLCNIDDIFKTVKGIEHYLNCMESIDTILEKYNEGVSMFGITPTIEAGREEISESKYLIKRGLENGANEDIKDDYFTLQNCFFQGNDDRHNLKETDLNNELNGYESYISGGSNFSGLQGKTFKSFFMCIDAFTQGMLDVRDLMPENVVTELETYSDSDLLRIGEEGLEELDSPNTGIALDSYSYGTKVKLSEAINLYAEWQSAIPILTKEHLSDDIENKDVQLNQTTYELNSSAYWRVNATWSEIAEDGRSHFGEVREKAEKLTGMDKNLEVVLNDLTQYKSSLSELKSTLDSLSTATDVGSLDTLTNKIKNLYITDGVPTSVAQAVILGLTEEEKDAELKNVEKADKEIYKQIIDDYINGELTEAEMLELQIIYPELADYTVSYCDSIELNESIGKLDDLTPQQRKEKLDQIAELKCLALTAQDIYATSGGDNYVVGKIITKETNDGFDIKILEEGKSPEETVYVYIEKNINGNDYRGNLGENFNKSTIENKKTEISDLKVEKDEYFKNYLAGKVIGLTQDKVKEAVEEGLKLDEMLDKFGILGNVTSEVYSYLEGYYEKTKELQAAEEQLLNLETTAQYFKKSEDTHISTTSTSIIYDVENDKVSVYQVPNGTTAEQASTAKAMDVIYNGDNTSKFSSNRFKDSESAQNYIIETAQNNGHNFFGTNTSTLATNDNINDDIESLHIDSGNASSQYTLNINETSKSDGTVDVGKKLETKADYIVLDKQISNSVINS